MISLGCHVSTIRWIALIIRNDISSTDLERGYWQVKVDKSDQRKTALITTVGLYEYQVKPFKPSRAPATFQLLSDTLFAVLKCQRFLVYLADMVVFCGTFQEQLERLSMMFYAIRKRRLISEGVMSV